MELGEFALRAGRTDRTEDPDRGLQIVLHGIAGEAGSVVSEAKKWFREGRPPVGLSGRVDEELGDLLWHVAALANRLGLNLDSVAAKSLTKAEQNFAQELPGQDMTYIGLSQRNARRSIVGDLRVSAEQH